MAGIFIAHLFKRLLPGLSARRKTGLFFRFLKDTAEPAYKYRRNGDPKRCVHLFTPFHLISFRLKPYRPMAVQTMTQKAPTSHALPR